MEAPHRTPSGDKSAWLFFGYQEDAYVSVFFYLKRILSDI